MKDTTLSGLFAALGSSDNSNENLTSSTVIKQNIELISETTIDINAFNKSYQELSSVSTNVGNAVRKAIFYYFKSLFNNCPIKWSKAFNYRNYEEE